VEDFLNLLRQVFSNSFLYYKNFYNDTVGKKGKNTRLTLIRRQNMRLIERLAARIKQIADDPVIEESCNTTQQPQILDISDEYAP
jgi:hypothetical protein